MGRMPFLSPNQVSKHWRQILRCRHHHKIIVTVHPVYLIFDEQHYATTLGCESTCTLLLKIPPSPSNVIMQPKHRPILPSCELQKAESTYRHLSKIAHVRCSSFNDKCTTSHGRIRPQNLTYQSGIFPLEDSLPYLECYWSTHQVVAKPTLVSL